MQQSKSATRVRRPLRIVRHSAPEIRGAERSALVEALFRIYSSSSSGIAAEAFETEVFPSEETRLALFYDVDEIVGFSYATIARVRHEGRAHAVFGAGVFFAPGRRGGAASAVFGLTEALRFKLREPRTPLAYIARASSPAPYALFARMMPCLHPRRDTPPPPAVESLVRSVARMRGLRHVGPSAWIVGSTARPTNAERFGASTALGADPDVRFYLASNPGFASGEAMLVWMRLDLGDIVRALGRALWERVTR